MLPSFTIPLDNSNIHWVPISPVACIISVTSPDNPWALCLFISFSAAVTSSILWAAANDMENRFLLATLTFAKLSVSEKFHFCSRMCSGTQTRSTYWVLTFKPTIAGSRQRGKGERCVKSTTPITHHAHITINYKTSQSCSHTQQSSEQPSFLDVFHFHVYWMLWNRTLGT